MTTFETRIEDEGDALQVCLIKDGRQVGGCLVDLELLGVDEGYRLATLLAQVFQVQEQTADHGTS